MGADGGEDVATSNGEKIFVSVRVRPLNGKETRSNDFLDWECINDTTIVFKNCLGERSMYPNAYNFDRVFGCDCSTKQVYEEAAKQIALSVVSGINSSIFAYGQTSSGKTYTMAGITQYTIADIYDYIDTHKEREFVLKFSAMEIYNEAVKDLLILDPTPLRLLDDPERGTVVERLTEETLKDKSHLLELLAVCEAQRQIGETSLNETSSRSHQILRLTVESSARQYLGARNSSTLTASVNFVDLAGSERTSQTLSAGTRLKEGCHINRSLLTLGKVIRALSKGRTGHVPYRDSKLTRILQNSLGGNARTAIICTMSPAHGHLEQTRNTLLFASCAKEVSTNARVNVVMSDKALVKHLRKELSRLESELKNMSLVSSKGDVAAVLKEKELQIEKMDKELKELSRQRDLAQSKIDEILSSKVQNQVSRGQDDSPQFSKPREKISWLDDSTITSDTDDYQRLDMDLTISESFTYLDGHGSFDISNQHADDDLLGNFQDQLLTDDYSPNLLSNNTVDLIAPDDHCDWNESNEDSEDKRQVLTHESSPNLLTNTSVEVVARSTNEESEDKLRVLTDESSPHVISDNTIDHVALDLTQDQDGISKSNNEDFDNNHRVLVDESSPQDVDEIPRRTNEDSEDKLQVLTVESSLNASSDNTIDHVTVDLPQGQDEISKSINEDSDNKCQVPHDQDEISKSIDEDSDNKRQVPHDQDETSKSIDEDYDNKGQVSIDEFSQDSHDRDEPPRSTNEDYEDNWKEVRCIEVLDSKPVSNILKNSPTNEVINKEDDEYAIIPCDKNKVNESHQTNAEYAELAKRIKELQRTVDNLISRYPLEHSPYSTESDIASSRGLSLSRSRSCKAILTCNASFANKYEETPFEGLEREYSIRHRRFCSSRRSSRRGFHSSIRNAIVNEMEHDVKMSNASDFSSTDGSLDKPEHHKEPSHDMDAEVMEVNETEMKDERTEETARDDMRDSVSGALQSPPSWAEEFESQRRRIIELWDACYIPLVHRTYFYLLFKGDPSDKLYIEVELRRLSYMKSKLSHGGKVIMDGHTLTTSSSKRALNEERDILSRQIYKRIPVKERETLFQKWGIPLNSKQRRMQLAHHVWTDTLDMNHVKESASLVAMLVGFVDNDEVPKEMFVGLSFSSRNFNKRSSSWKGGMSSLL